MGVKRKIAKSADNAVDLQELFDDFIEQKISLNLSPATIVSYKGSFDRFYNMLGERNKNTDITEGTIYAFINTLSNDMVKPTSVNHYLRDLRSFFKWCFAQGLLKEFKIPQIKEQESIKETYTEDELIKLTTKPPKTATFVQWRTYAIVNWILATGNRAETICNVTLGDLSFGKNEITLAHTKNKKAQIIPMGREIALVLKEYIRLWRGDARDIDYLFCNIGDEKLTVNALKHSLRDYNKSREVDKTSIHALRHTFAKNWILNTGDVFRLQKILGHSTLEMTRRYVNMFNDDLKDNFEQFNPLDRLKKSQVRKQAVKKTNIQ